jgi:hypothetical protein
MGPVKIKQKKKTINEKENNLVPVDNSKYRRFRLFFKQWPLAGEFVEFEYSPKIRQIFVTRSGEFGEY